MANRRSSVTSIAITTLAVLLSCALHAVEFSVGAAAVKITPPQGTPLAGFYAMRPSTGVLDDIYSKAMVIEQDGAKVAIVSLDMCYTTRPIILNARKLIAEKTGIPAERVLISATHTHTGPALERQATIDELTGARTPAAVQYAASLPALIAQSVIEANEKRAPARAHAAIEREENLSFNRRFVMKDGTFGWNIPKSSANNVLRPSGPIDPDVGVLYIETSANPARPIATYVNFAMHPVTVGGTKISSDYPHFLCKRLAEHKGPEMITLFANGCCGNIGHRDISSPDAQSGVRESDRIGSRLAAAVQRAYERMTPLQAFAPRVATQMVSLPLRKFTEQQAEKARAVVLRMSDPKLSTTVKAEAFCVLDVLAREGKPLEVEIQAIALSDELAIVALPGEIFVELGLELKKSSPFKYTLIAELANGSIGYIPNRAAFPEGNYEVVSARTEEGSGELLIETALKLLKDLRAPAPK
ncbi:MAG TPA: neutral/alkaline non-lysosomal ceramidase N-terminal domain-containing protein [Planctomycetota bacterium]|nr:neutral/alkaline non-lysosomal ceramidase N-terminal domain-containing protein [Planctomycetota bacterium]